MKRFFVITAASLALCGAAAADPVAEVFIPKDVQTEAGAHAYTEALDKAVERVCRKANQPMMGVAYYSYLNCVKATKADVAAREPTGLYASRFGLERPTTLAQR